MEMPSVTQANNKQPQANFMPASRAALDAAMGNIPPVSFNISGSAGDSSLRDLQQQIREFQEFQAFKQSDAYV